MVLEARHTQVGEVVEGGVVVSHAIDEAEVVAGNARALEHAEVGVVGQALVHGAVE
jgi:hypothetical protein